MDEPRILSEQELIDWERWSKREISWKSSDVARLIATIRDLQKRKPDSAESERD
jgi:hypothetical protein